MQYLKALVIGLGILILLCIGLLAYGLLTKTGAKKSSEAVTSGQTDSPFGSVVLTDYPGCVISSAWSEGNRLFARLDGTSPLTASGCQVLIVVDMLSGDTLGTVRLERQ